MRTSYIFKHKNYSKHLIFQNRESICWLCAELNNYYLWNRKKEKMNQLERRQKKE